MRPIEPAELSAYLDGELAPSRAKEIEARLASDPALRAQYEELRMQDAAWMSAARSALSVPRVRLGPVENRWQFGARSLLLVGGLLAVRLVPKFGELVGLGITLHLIVLALALAWVVDSARRPP